MHYEFLKMIKFGRETFLLSFSSDTGSTLAVHGLLHTLSFIYEFTQHTSTCTSPSNSACSFLFSVTDLRVGY